MKRIRALATPRFAAARSRCLGCAEPLPKTAPASAADREARRLGYCNEDCQEEDEDDG